MRQMRSEIVLVTSLGETFGAMDVARIVGASVSHCATAIWIRQANWTTRQLIEFADLIRRARSIPIWIGRDLDAARGAAAEAIIFPSSSPRAASRAFVGRVGYSVHGVGEARERASDGADFLVFGPVRDTVKNGSVVSGVGFERLREICGAVPVPVIGIGGLAPCDLPQLADCGAVGLGSIRAMQISG